MFISMLPIYILSKYNIRPSNGVLYQSLNFTIRLCSSSDSSDSDSDSDNEKAKLKGRDENEQKSAQVTSDLTSYLNNMMMARKTQKTIDVALQPKKKENKSRAATNLPYEKRLIRAAEDVANTIGGDKTKTTSDLLQKVLKSRVEALREQQFKEEQNTKLWKNKKWRQPSESEKQDSENKSIIQTLLNEYNKQSSIKNKQSPVGYKQPSESERQDLEKKSIIQTLLDEYNKQSPVKDKEPVKNSTSRQLLSSIDQSSGNNKKKFHARTHIKIWNGKPTQIFEQMITPASNIPELKTWATLEQRELKALTIYPPANVFQEMILWTEQGKLWKFPIDNEQGMEEENNIHFVEHVFMERHLKDWCPKSGPIRHFMELVCTGLSKNPYLTVREKVDHIMWYKDYFAAKQDLLKELGAIEDPFPAKVKEITE